MKTFAEAPSRKQTGQDTLLALTTALIAESPPINNTAAEASTDRTEPVERRWAVANNDLRSPESLRYVLEIARRAKDQ